MKKVRNSLFVLIFSMAAQGWAANSDDSSCPPQAKAVHDLAWRAAAWQIAHPQTNRYPTGDWVVAPFHNGLVAMGKASGDARFLDAARTMCCEIEWKPIKTIWVANDDAAIQTFLELYLLDRDPAQLKPGLARLDATMAAVARLDDDLTFTRTNYGKWSWCDSLYMSPPAYTLASKCTGEAKYLAYVDEWWWKASGFLYDTNECLFFRDNTFFKKREPNGQKVFWSRGNGWVFGGLVRVLENMPAQYPSRSRYESQFKQMAARLGALQQPDGFWHASLLDPKAFPSPESSGTGFFVYGLAWAVNHGLLEPAKYSPVIEKGWQALAGAVQPDGKLGWVQRIGDAPGHTSAASTEPYGVGAFLLADSEVFRLKQQR